MNYELKKSLLELKNKLLLFSLTGVLGLTATGCSKTDNDKHITKVTIIDNNNLMDESIEESKTLPTIESIEEVNETIVETVPVEETLPNSYDEVMNLINSNSIEKVYYATSDVSLSIPDYLSDTNIDEVITLPELECLEVYDEVDGTCLVKTNEYIGFTTLDNLEELTGTFVVVDISSQEVKLYKDNQVVLTSPVVTGKPKRSPSDKGLFEIYDISGHRYLVGPGYKSYVDIMMKYNGGEGLHDAEYHTHEDGFKHGWRDASEFGGDTYIKHGSHGCINMLHDDVMTIRDNVDIGTKVLVKE